MSVNAVTARRPYAWASAVLCLSVGISIGCTPGGTANIINGVELHGLSQRPNEFCDATDPAKKAQCTPQLRESLQFAKLGVDDIEVSVRGAGRCNGFTIDFGDGASVNAPAAQVTGQVLPVSHKYTNWPGTKQIKVTGADCLGEPTKQISVGIDDDGHEEFRVGYKPTTSVCNPVQHLSTGVAPILRPGTVVKIEASGKIRYGIMEHDASGDRTIAAPPGYAFPLMRPYSLVYGVQPSVTGATLIPFQGENGPTIFTVPARGFLNICVNDHPMQLTDNISAGMFLQITVNESQATGQ